MKIKLKNAVDRRMANAGLSDSARARIIREIKQGAPRRQVKASRTLIIAVAAAAVMMAGAVAIYAVRDDIRLTMASWEETHQGKPLALSQTDGGYTVKLDRLYGDTRYLYLHGTVERADEKPWQADQKIDRLGSAYSAVGFCNRTFSISNMEEQLWYGSSIRCLRTEEENTVRYEFILRLGAKDFPLTGNATVTFDGLWYEVDGKTQQKAGRWEFTVPIDRKDDGETLEVHQQISLPGGTVTLERLRFSALDVSADWSGENNEVLFGSNQECSETYLLLKSGDKVPFDGASVDGENTKIVMTFAPFNKGLGHISAADVQAVVYAGEKIPLA